MESEKAKTHGDDENVSNSASSPNSNSNQANTSDEVILPAFYAPSSIFPTSVTNKIDLSSSVSQYLKKETLAKETGKKTDSYVNKHENDNNATSDLANDNDSTGSRSPAGRTPPANSFEFFSRQIPETSHPAPQALDDKPSPSVDYDSASELSTRNISSPLPVKPTRKSIYEMSSDDEHIDDTNNKRGGDNIRSLSDDENDDSQGSPKQNTFASKDKDMRLSSLFMDKDYSNGDIDLRLPFKPVMANYIPATEIDASITSHAPINYSVN